MGIQECKDLLDIVGLRGPIYGGGTRVEEFEEHFLMNKKVVAISGTSLFGVYDIEYCNNEDGNIWCGDALIPQRRMRYYEFQATVPPVPVVQFIDALIFSGFGDGFPFGFVTNEDQRIQEILSLGKTEDHDFCTLVHYNSGEIRVYQQDIVPVL